MATSGLVTIAFTDLVASTELSESAPLEVADRVRREHTQGLRTAVTATNGTVVKTIGDSLMGSWASAADALRGAVAMQQAVARQNRAGVGPALSMRVGLSAGDATFEDDDWFGRPVVEAARLCTQAEGGQILATDIVRVLAANRADVEVRPLGEQRLKGLSEPVAVCEVTWAAEHDGAAPLPSAVERALTSGLGFVGREKHVGELHSAAKEAANGACRLALISGEPGIGKTRLVAEVAAAAHAEGATILWGGCDEDLGVPYQPFAEAVGELVHREGGQDLVRSLGPMAGELATLIPDLDRFVAGLDVPTRSDADVDRLRLFDAVGELLAELAAPSPVVLVLDDLHWAGKPTLLLVRHLIRSPRSSHLLVMGTYRDTDLDRRHPLADVLADLRRDEGVIRVTLSGLSEDGVEALMASAAGHDLSATDLELVTAVHRETEGNPFFVREVLLHLVESGALVRQDGRWTSHIRPEQMGIPEGVREVIGRRLSRLPEATNDLLATAAVLGRTFDLALLASVCGESLDVALERLEPAERANLLRPSRGSARYEFAHALVRSTLYEELPTSRRLRLHRDAGVALEAMGVAEQGLADLARHFGEAAALGEVARAVEYGRRAGDRASEDLADEEAITHYERALLALDLPGDVDPAARRRLLIALGGAQARSGDPAHVATLEAAAALARSAGDTIDFAEAAAVLGAYRFARTGYGTTDDGIVTILTEALELVPDDNVSLRARLSAHLVTGIMFTDQHERRRALSDESVRLARASADPAVIAEVLGARVAVLDAGDPVSSTRYRTELDEAVELGEQSTDYLRCLCLLRRAPYRMAEGDRAGAEADLDGVRDLVSRVRVAALENLLLTFEASLLLVSGRLDEAEAAIQASAAFAQDHELEWITALSSQYFRLRYEQGRLDELVPALLDRLEATPNVPAWRIALASAYVQSDQLTEAATHLEVLAADDFAMVNHDNTWLFTMAGIARNAALSGLLDIAARAYDLVLPHCGQLGFTGLTFEQPIDLSLGVAAAALGRFDEAEAHYADSVELSVRAGAPTFVAVSRLHWALALVARGGPGDDERSRDLAAAAMTTATELGLGRIERLAAQILD